MSSATRSRALLGWCVFVLAWASFVLFLGANVTTTASGDVTPDWPQSWNGEWSLLSDLMNLPDKLRNELSHRYGVPFLALFTLILAVWTQIRGRTRAARVAGWTAFGLLLAQALLGGIRVKEWIPIETSAPLHAILAEVYFCTLVAMLALLSPSWSQMRPRPAGPQATTLRRRADWALGLLFAQLVLGALGRHGAIPREIHVVFAVVVVIAILRATSAVRKEPAETAAFLRRPASMLTGLLHLQIGLGIWTYVLTLTSEAGYRYALGDVLPLNLHLVAGAWLLGTSLFLCLRVRRLYGAESPAATALRAAAGGAS